MGWSLKCWLVVILIAILGVPVRAAESSWEALSLARTKLSSESEYPGHMDSDYLPTTYHARFANIKSVRRQPVEPRQAELFIKAHTDRGGDADRRVPVRIRLRLKSLKNEEHDCLAEVQTIIVYQGRARPRVLAEMTTPAEKSPGKADSDRK